MPRATTQEFRVTCFRPAGGMERNPDAPLQAEESFTVYASGRGKTLETRAANAAKRTKEIMSIHGYDRFLVTLTVGDEEKRRETIHNELMKKEYGDDGQTEGGQVSVRDE